MIPVGDSPVSRGRPWVNYAIIAINVAVFLYLLTLDTSFFGTRGEINAAVQDAANGICYGLFVPPTEIDHFYCEFGFQPREFFDTVQGNELIPVDSTTVYLSLFTSAFMHGGWLHIAGNMLFLWVFGDNVEDRFGHAGYLVFYLASAVTATLVQGAIDTNDVIPVIGASGAVAGVLGAYLVLYPKATVYVVIPFFIFFLVPLPIPAVLMIGIWFVQNLFSGFASIGSAASPDAGVAWFAHIGGFVFGLLVAFALRGGRRRAPPRWP